jgi:hypothetical protein
VIEYFTRQPGVIHFHEGSKVKRRTRVDAALRQCAA